MFLLHRIKNIRIRPSTLFQSLSIFKNVHSESGLKKLMIGLLNSPNTCGWKANPQRKSSDLKITGYVWAGSEEENSLELSWFVSKLEI